MVGAVNDPADCRLLNDVTARKKTMLDVRRREFITLIGGAVISAMYSIQPDSEFSCSG
jgi:hypothetical protein